MYIIPSNDYIITILYLKTIIILNSRTPFTQWITPLLKEVHQGQLQTLLLKVNSNVETGHTFSTAVNSFLQPKLLMDNIIQLRPCFLT